MVGLDPSSTRPRRAVTNIGTRVPSLLWKNTWRVSNAVPSNALFGILNGATAPVFAS